MEDLHRDEGTRTYARTKAVLTGTAALLTVGLVAPAPAGAVTGGTVDSTNVHENVGMLAFYDDGVRYRCSGTLVSPTVVLTAAHCTSGTEGKTLVTSDPDIAQTPPGPCDPAVLPVASDPAAGYRGTRRPTARTGPRAPRTPTRSTRTSPTRTTGTTSA